MAANRPLHSSGISFLPEENPYKHIFVDVTNRCNMKCKNCYVSHDSDIADLDIGFLMSVIRKLPYRTNIRLLGGEPTLRRDLPEIIQGIRLIGHTPVLITNGLKLTDMSLVRSLKSAGLRTIHLSCNGGLSDAVYESIDQLRCAKDKMHALDNLCQEKFSVSVGVILVPGVNTEHLLEFSKYLKDMKSVRELKLRSVGSYGRWMDGPSLTMSEMMELCEKSLGITRKAMDKGRHCETLCSFSWEGKRIQLTQWPDLNNRSRGYLTPMGTIEPFFEFLIANGQL